MVGASCEVHYSAAKAGVIGLTKPCKRACTLRHPGELHCAGLIETDMLKDYTEAELGELKKEIPSGGFGTPFDVAECALYLADEKKRLYNRSGYKPQRRLCRVVLIVYVFYKKQKTYAQYQRDISVFLFLRQKKIKIRAVLNPPLIYSQRSHHYVTLFFRYSCIFYFYIFHCRIKLFGLITSAAYSFLSVVLQTDCNTFLTTYYIPLLAVPAAI
jgi:hypothetical protein